MQGVFDTRRDTEEDDSISHRYHFPNHYLDAAKDSVGDWLIFREQIRGKGRGAYIAAAREDCN